MASLAVAMVCAQQLSRFVHVSLDGSEMTVERSIAPGFHLAVIMEFARM